MDFNKLIGLLTPGQDGVLSIEAARFETAAVVSLVSDFLDGALKAKGVSINIDHDQQQVTVAKGTLSAPFLKIANASVKGTFTLKGETLSAQIAIHDLGSGWKMSDSFPVLQDSTLDGFSYDTPQFVLDSEQKTPLPPDFHAAFGYPASLAGVTSKLVTGLCFSASLGLKDSLQELAPFVEARLAVSGPIELYRGLPQMRLVTNGNGGKTVELGRQKYSLPMAFEVAVLFDEFAGDAGDDVAVLPIAAVALRTRLDIGGALQPIRISGLFYGQDLSTVRFSGEPEGPAQLSLETLPKLLDGTSVGDLIPREHDFPNLDIVHLSRIGITASLRPFALRDIDVELEVGGPGNKREWSIFANLVRFSDLKVRFSIENISSGRPPPRVALFAAASVSSAVLTGYVSLPDLLFVCDLKEGVIDIKAIVEEIVANPVEMPKITCSSFRVSGNVSTSTYAFDATIQNDWPIDIGDTKLLLSKLSLKLEHGPAAGGGTAGAILAEFEIPKKMSFLVSAEYNTSGSGWRFTGETRQPVDLDISGFLAATFDGAFSGKDGKGGSTAPSMLASVSIKALYIDFNAQTKDFHFDAEIDFGKGGEVRTILSFSNLHQEGTAPPTFEKRATGVMVVFADDNEQELDFGLGIDLGPKSNHFIALYNNPAGKAAHFGKLVKALYPDYSGPDFNFDITIKDAIAGYASDPKRAIFAIDLGASIDLSSLGTIPLVGQSLSAAKTLRLAVQLIYPTGAFTTDDLGALNNLITVAGPRLPADKTLKDLSVKTELRLGDGAPIDVSLPITIDSSPGGGGQLKPDSGSFTAPGSQPTDDGVKWLALDKKFGPVNLQRVGFKYDSGAITVLIDGGLTAFGLEVDLMGLSVTSKLTGAGVPQFGLQGLGIAFSKGGVEIAGALLHLHDDKTKVDTYDGLAIVQAEGLRLAAIGALTTIQQQPSLFLYAVLDYPLGGSPFFYVTGLAGGFGLNRKLVMPAVDQVKDFPLVKAARDPNPPAMPTDPSQTGGFIEQQMGPLETSLVPSLGQYFGCVGVKFTSFELLNSFLLVSLSFGQEFELDLLGISTLVVPPQEPPSAPALAVISLQLAASFIPDEGIAIVQGRLTPDSHLFTLDCHITGGFAFAAWFGKNTNAGDFVVTLGGYHPDFKKPDHYPAVPRIGVNWQICPELSVTGGLYFALTPRALMAGGAMQAIFQLHVEDAIASADIRAWFTLGADFIVYWKPFHYSAHLYVDMGIDIVIHFLGTHDIGLDAAADLDVWGPPFAGRAHISLTVIGIKIGFNVAFGPSAPTPDPLLWDASDPSKSFLQSFLPKKTKDIVSVAIDAGLVRKMEDAGKTWHVINPKDFRVHTHSLIPIKACDKADDLRWTESKQHFAEFGSNVAFGINPMHKGSAAVHTSHQIKVTLCDQAKTPMEKHFLLEPIKSSVPGGLWASENWTDKNVPSINAERLIEKAASGFAIVPDATHVVGPIKSLERNSVAFVTELQKNAYADGALKAFTALPGPGDDPDANEKLWKQIQGEIHANTTRSAMLSSMGFAEPLDIGELFVTDTAYAPSYGSLSS